MSSKNPNLHQQEKPDYLTTAEAASYLRCSKSYLDKLRVAGGGPIYLKLSGGKVLYARADLIAWMESRRCRATNRSPGDDG